MKKLLGILTIFLLLLFCSCTGGSSLKNYKNEVSYEEFSEKFENLMKGSSVGNYRESDFYFCINDERINVIQGEKEKQVSKVEIKHDVAKNKAKITTINDRNKKENTVEQEDPLYKTALNQPQQIIRMYIPYYPYFKYYVDGDVLTTVYIFDELGIQGSEVVEITQIVIKKNSICMITVSESNLSKKTVVTELILKSISL